MEGKKDNAAFDARASEHYERLEHFIQTQYKRREDFCKKVGIALPGANHYLGGRNKFMSMEAVMKIRRFEPSFNLDWWFYGEGEMVLESPPVTAPSEHAVLEVHKTAANLKQLRALQSAVNALIKQMS